MTSTNDSMQQIIERVLDEARKYGATVAQVTLAERIAQALREAGYSKELEQQLAAEREARKGHDGEIVELVREVTAIRKERDQLRQQIASLKENARVCEECQGSGRYAEHDGWAHKDCPHCTNGVRFDKKGAM